MGKSEMTLSTHADSRLKERHGIKIDESDAQKIIDDIQNQRCVFLCKGHNSHESFFAIMLQKKAFPVLYSKKTKKIITIYHRTKFPYLLGKHLSEAI